MNVGGSYGPTKNYEPTSAQGPKEGGAAYKIHAQPIAGPIGRYTYTHPNTNYEQPRTLFNKVFDDAMRTKVMDNIAGHMAPVDTATKERQLQHFMKVDPKLGNGIAERLGLATSKARL